MPKLGPHGTRFEDVICKFLGGDKAKPGAQHDFSIGVAKFQSKYSKYYPVHPGEVESGHRKNAYRWVWVHLFGDSSENIYDWLLLSGLKPGFKLSDGVDHVRLFLIPYSAIRQATKGNRIECGTQASKNCKQITNLILERECDAEKLRSWAAELRAGIDSRPSHSVGRVQGSLFK